MKKAVSRLWQCSRILSSSSIIRQAQLGPPPPELKWLVGAFVIVIKQIGWLVVRLLFLLCRVVLSVACTNNLMPGITSLTHTSALRHAASHIPWSTWMPWCGETGFSRAGHGSGLTQRATRSLRLRVCKSAFALKFLMVL